MSKNSSLDSSLDNSLETPGERLRRILGEPGPSFAVDGDEGDESGSDSDPSADESEDAVLHTPWKQEPQNGQSPWVRNKSDPTKNTDDLLNILHHQVRLLNPNAFAAATVAAFTREQAQLAFIPPGPAHEAALKLLVERYPLLHRAWTELCSRR